MITKEQIRSSGVFTQEMRKVLTELAEMINYARAGGKNIESITLSRKQWEPIRKDRKRNNWKIPRPCGFIHYEDSEPSFDGVNLSAPSAQDFREYIQEDAFNAPR